VISFRESKYFTGTGMLGQGRKEATYGTLLESPVGSVQPRNQFKMLKAKCKEFSWFKLKIKLQNLDLKVLAVLCWIRIQEHRN
jgi:hypothetical protein